MPTINIADKSTLDTIKTDTSSILSRGGIKSSGTDIQAYNTNTSSWDSVNLGGSGGSSTITILNKNNLYTNKVFTIESEDGTFNENVTMVNDKVSQVVPYVGKYNISWSQDSNNVVTIRNFNIYGYGNHIFTPFKFVSFSSGTDEEIAIMLDMHYMNYINIEDYWSVGDTRLIHMGNYEITDQDITCVILDFNHTDLADTINNHTKSAITVQTRETITGSNMYINKGDKGFTKWADIYMRKYINSIVYDSISSDIFKSNIKLSSHYRHTGYNTNYSEQVFDKLFLPSEPEIGLSSSGSYIATSPVEGTQFEYYKLYGAVKYINNNGSTSSKCNYWTGSAASYYSSGSGYSWYYINNTSYYAYGAYALSTVSAYVAPAWAM